LLQDHSRCDLALHPAKSRPTSTRSETLDDGP
jgi:hypothetical protein